MQPMIILVCQKINFRGAGEIMYAPKYHMIHVTEEHIFPTLHVRP